MLPTTTTSILLHSARMPLHRAPVALMLGKGASMAWGPAITQSSSRRSCPFTERVEATLKDEKKPALTTPDATSTVPTMVRGDWVLFHPVYSPEELKAVEVIHREPKTFADSAARGLVQLARKMFDLVSGYKHKPLPADWKTWPIQKLREEGYILDDKAWLRRILFLESIAGVPGMVAATLRHLQSLRLMRRDNGWIHTCLEEAENERMHLMTFMTLRQPSIWFRAMVIGAQGVFYNLFFLSYMVSPKICHRFVGYLEEEAVVTYTRCIQDLESGLLPEWADKPAPEIAIDYWRMPKDSKMLDLIYAVRSDETTHRFVNHSLANLDPKTDVNPFALREPDMLTKGKVIEFDRDEAEAYVQESHQLYGKKEEP
ncbi:hypothetical protein NMY22_g13717 [Coprinellus aureogranulatus]|nr:hypothetical protein NMY22_g13717 [Coprinellus aureogranulatus]